MTSFLYSHTVKFLISCEMETTLKQHSNNICGTLSKCPLSERICLVYPEVAAYTSIELHSLLLCVQEFTEHHYQGNFNVREKETAEKNAATASIPLKIHGSFKLLRQLNFKQKISP